VLLLVLRIHVVLQREEMLIVLVKQPDFMKLVLNAPPVIINVLHALDLLLNVQRVQILPGKENLVCVKLPFTTLTQMLHVNLVFTLA